MPTVWRRPSVVAGVGTTVAELLRYRLRAIIEPLLPPHTSAGLGQLWCIVEQTTAVMHHNRRLKVRYEWREGIHQAFHNIACIKVCWYPSTPDLD